MKQYSKKEAIQIITSSARAYEESLNRSRFLLAYRDSGSLQYAIVRFTAKNFKHLTGVVTDIPANQFYQKCLHHQLSPDDFQFDQTGNTNRKLEVLPMLPKMFHGHALRGEFARTGIQISADYFVGTTGHLVSLGFRRHENGDFPVSLYCEDVRNLTASTQKVIAIWKMEPGQMTNTYLAKNENEELLLEELRASGAPLPQSESAGVC